MKPSISEEILKKHGLKGVHPIADLFPLLDGAERDAFDADVEAHGVALPVTCDADHLLLDGRNRLLAADKAGRPIQFNVCSLTGKAAVDFIITLNLHRRHLTDGQRGMIADQLATMTHGGNRRSEQEANLPLETAAKRMNVSPRTVRTARVVRRKAAPEVVAAVESGEMTLNAAHETVKRLEQPEQVGAKATELLSAEIDDQCLARIQKIVRPIQELFSALDATRLRFARQTLQNEIERIYSKAQKKKQARAAKLAQQKLASDGEAGWGPSSRDTSASADLTEKRAE